MKYYRCITSLTCAIMVLFSITTLSAQEASSAQPAQEASSAQPPVSDTQNAPVPEVAPEVAQPPTQTPEPPAPVVPDVKEMPIYGEVQSVDTASNSVTMQYYDYDTDEEKSIVVTIAADTKLENASGVSDIKKGDWMDVVYIVLADKNQAKLISVEKEESLAPDEDVAPPQAQ